MKKSMMVPEKSNPEMMAPPRPLQSGSVRVIGTKPMMVAKVVSAIGSSLEAEASPMDSTKLSPLLVFSTILSTIKIEFLTTIPNKAKIPIKAGKDSGVRVRANKINTPAIDGIPKRIAMR